MGYTEAHFGFAARAPFSIMRYRTTSGRLLVPRTTKRYAPGQVSLPRERKKLLTFTSESRPVEVCAALRLLLTKMVRSCRCIEWQ